MQDSNNDVYFIEDIIEVEDSKNVVLLNTSTWKQEYIDETSFSIIQVNKISFSIGEFVYLTDNNEMLSANNSPEAKKCIYVNNIYRGLLKGRYDSDKIETLLNHEDLTVFTYHVNVGHGNCSIIVLIAKDCCEFWLVDCGAYDIIQRQSYSKNIEDCITHIQNKFNNRIKFNRCFITHPHFDHYSGLDTLFFANYINSNTIFYLNYNYPMPSPTYNIFLQNIKTLKCKIIEPLSSVKDNFLQILYPNKTVIKKHTKKYPLGSNVITDNNPNNASSVLKFKFNNKIIIFTGDIEQNGWKECNCTALCGCTYYIVSHHGSRNGIPPFCKLFFNNSKYQVIMGRDQAFSGIYSPLVTKNSSNVIYSEKNNNNISCQFLEINLKSDIAKWY